MSGHSIQRYHDISTGHRVAGHENKCAHLHGHNYRVHFHCVAQKLDDLGRVVDFSVVKSRLCMWLEDNWDHKFLVWELDPWLSPGGPLNLASTTDQAGVVTVPFNPTAENMAEHLVEVVGPEQLEGTGVVLTAVRIDETRKCSASYEWDPFGGAA